MTATLRRLAALALNTFREAVRDRVLYASCSSRPASSCSAWSSKR